VSESEPLLSVPRAPNAAHGHAVGGRMPNHPFNSRTSSDPPASHIADNHLRARPALDGTGRSNADTTAIRELSTSVRQLAIF